MEIKRKDIKYQQEYKLKMIIHYVNIEYNINNLLERMKKFKLELT